jgi:hypothetical protein
MLGKGRGEWWGWEREQRLREPRRVKEQIGSVGIPYTQDMARERNATIIIRSSPARRASSPPPPSPLLLLHSGYLDIRKVCNYQLLALFP